ADQPGGWFYFQILATALPPWTALVVGRLIDDVRAVWRGGRLDTLEVLLWAWTAAVVGFFSLSTFKLDHYVFPAAPALCVVSTLEQRKVVPEVARWVSARAHSGDRIASFRLNRWNPAFRFYVDRSMTFLEDPAEAATFFSEPGSFYCVMRRSAYDEFVAKGVP